MWKYVKFIHVEMQKKFFKTHLSFVKRILHCISFSFLLYFTIIKLRPKKWKLCKLKHTSILPQLSHYWLQNIYANHHLPNTISDLFMYSFDAFSLIFLSIPWKHLLKFQSHITLWSFSLTVVKEGTYYKHIIVKSRDCV